MAFVGSEPVDAAFDVGSSLEFAAAFGIEIVVVAVAAETLAAVVELDTVVTGWVPVAFDDAKFAAGM